MRYPVPAARSVLVTGCSSGIGLATARVLRAAGWQVIPTARREADLARLRTEGFDPVALDVGDPVSVAACVEATLAKTGGRLGALVNNAGYGQPGALEDISRDALRRQFEVNVFGLQDLTNRLLPVFRREGAGRVVNVGSVVGRLSPAVRRLLLGLQVCVGGNGRRPARRTDRHRHRGGVDPARPDRDAVR